MNSIIMSKQENKFPCLMVYTPGTIFVLLFTKPRTGMIVNSEHPRRLLGDYGVDWDMAVFTPFEGEIILRN